MPAQGRGEYNQWSGTHRAASLPHPFPQSDSRCAQILGEVRAKEFYLPRLTRLKGRRDNGQEPCSARAFVECLLPAQVAELGQQAPPVYDCAVLAGEEDFFLGLAAFKLSNPPPLKAGVDDGRGLAGHRGAVGKLVRELSLVFVFSQCFEGQPAGVVPALAGIMAHHFPTASVIWFVGSLPLLPGLRVKGIGLRQVGHGIFPDQGVPQIIQQPCRGSLALYIGQQGRGQVWHPVPELWSAPLQCDTGVGVALHTGPLYSLGNVLLHGVIALLQGVAEGLDLSGGEAVTVAEIFDQGACLASLELYPLEAHHTGDGHLPPLWGLALKLNRVQFAIVFVRRMTPRATILQQSWPCFPLTPALSF